MTAKPKRSPAAATVRDSRPPPAKTSRAGLPRAIPPKPAQIDGDSRSGGWVVINDYGWPRPRRWS
jgi:hypothetical protein